MSETSLRKFYRRSEFVALTTSEINLALLQAELATLTLAQPFATSELLALNAGVIVEWDSLPLAADVLAVTNKIAAHVGAETTSEPFSILSAAATTAANSTPVTKIDFTTPPLDPGTYSLTYTGQQRLVTAATGDSVRVLLALTFSGFPAFTQMHEWPFALTSAYNYSVTGIVTAGQTIRVQTSVSKNGAGAAVAECSKARWTIDKIAD